MIAMEERLQGTLKKILKEERLFLVIAHRFGLFTGVPKTLEEVSRIFCVTRERIRQLEAKALRILRHPSNRGFSELKELLEEIKGKGVNKC